ncbi:hypothetical protein WOLCODRAFT_134123 [Wolfiporia cocos MD-104 SS10]|uniref:Plasma membrane fusion protein PRM1 n=1 Tax=Wolfiporia cocos (strain MD-104) TaxID=742152 RepID=A0A2H3JBM0_WOLCO|nr:hypothetical protein WOLCODRAFT_134123 [Wolfiporia cocos MD-104 SS10]
MSSSPNAQWNSPSGSVSSGGLNPYLELPHLLSLTWLAYPILSLFFVAFRLWLSTDSAQSSVASAKSDLVSSCKAAQTAATSAASMPRYLAIAANDQIADAVNGTMDAARDTLILALTIMEGIINFIIDMYRSTFLCFLELVVRGGLSILIGAVQEINQFLTGTFNTIRTAIQNDVSSANSAIAKVVDEINKINPFGNISVPQFSIPALSDLENVTLPTDFETALEKLNNSLPTLSTLKSEIDSIVDTPFELLKKEINETFANLTFDRSVLPVPQENSLSFCDDLDTSFIDDLGQDLVKIAEIGVGILIVLALLILAANCAFEWYKWRCLKRHLQFTRDAWTSDPTVAHVRSSRASPIVDMSDHNLLILAADAQHPHLMKIANGLSRRLRLTPPQHVNLRWFMHYVFHPPALVCFLIGFFGLLSVEIQIAVVRPLADKFSEQAATTVSGYSELIVTSINGTMYNQSATYAADVNARVDAIQNSINDGMFGWVNGTTTTLNNTLNTFYTDLQNTVTTVFNGTILEEPVQEFIRCFIGGKVRDLEEALTFLHNNLQVNLPKVNESALVLSPADVNEVTTPIAMAAVGSGSGDDQGIVGELVDDYIKSLKAERIMFGVFLGLWIIVVLMALCIIFWHSYGKRWRDARRRRKWAQEQRGGMDGHIIPFRESMPGAGMLNRADSVGGETIVQGGASSPPRSKAGLPLPKAPVERDEFLPPPRHPMSVRNQEYEKSWDGYLDQGSKPPSGRHSLRISRPMRLMAMKRQTFGREGLAPDAEKSTVTLVEPEHQPRSWMSRMRRMLRKKDNDGDEESALASDQGSIREKARPPLTINVPKASNMREDELLNADRSAQEQGLKSAWSVSPGPQPKSPWIAAVHPGKKVKLPPLPSPSFKIRRPAEFRDSSEPVPVLVIAPQPQAVPMPLHHGFASPPLSPPYRRESRAPLLPPLIPVSQTSYDPDTNTPVTRLLTTINARHDSPVVDPFVTPFDDE